MRALPAPGWITLLENGWVMAYFFRAHGWPEDGWYFAFVGQDRSEIKKIRKIDWMRFEQAHTQQYLLWEE